MTSETVRELPAFKFRDFGAHFRGYDTVTTNAARSRGDVTFSSSSGVSSSISRTRRAFGGPVTNIQAGNAGQILSAASRVPFQLALKLIW